MHFKFHYGSWQHCLSIVGLNQISFQGKFALQFSKIYFHSHFSIQAKIFFWVKISFPYIQFKQFSFDWKLLLLWTKVVFPWVEAAFLVETSAFWVETNSIFMEAIFLLMLLLWFKATSLSWWRLLHFEGKQVIMWILILLLLKWVLLNRGKTTFE